MNGDIFVNNLQNTQNNCVDKSQCIKQKCKNTENEPSKPENESLEQSSFEKALDTATTKTNENCKKCADRENENVSNEIDSKKCCDKEQKNDGLLKSENICASEAALLKTANEGNNMPEQALRILYKAMISISDMLNINVKLPQDLSDIDFSDPSEAVLEHFSEILYSLKSILQILEKAVMENSALDVQGIVIEPQDASILERNLRVEVFRLEIALEELGVSGDISRMVAEKMDMPVLNNGIPVASDPDSLSMPKNQLTQILGNLFEMKEIEIKSVISRIAEIANEASAKENSAISEKIADIIKLDSSKKPNLLNLENSNIIVDKNTGSGKIENLCYFDPQVMRRLLKIDIGGQNQAETGNSDTDKPNSYNIMLSSNYSISKTQTFQQIFNLSQDSLEQITGIESFSNSESKSVSSDLFTQQTPLPFKSIEESIIMQVMDRFTIAARNGIHQVRLFLKPESLGDVRMTIRVDGDIVVARFQVENQQVKQIIESNLQSLKDSLEEHNLHAGSFDVNVNQGSEKNGYEAWKLDSNVHIAGDSDTGTYNDSTVLNIMTGQETGRRFGFNTIEFFA